ncbi:MAG TPA: hypothetical protein VGN14_01215 [Candidatus Elarobacter sp.]
MVGRRFAGCALLVGLAVPIMGSAPHGQRTLKSDVAIIPAPGMGTRVFARAESSGDAGTASPQPTPIVAASPSPEIAARARAEFEANRAGKIDRDRYTAEMNAIITDDTLARAAAELRTLGTVKSFAQVRRISTPTRTMYVFRIEFAGDGALPIEESIGWNAAGKVAYLAFEPAR